MAMWHVEETDGPEIDVSGFKKTDKRATSKSRPQTTRVMFGMHFTNTFNALATTSQEETDDAPLHACENGACKPHIQTLGRALSGSLTALEG